MGKNLADVLRRFFERSYQINFPALRLIAFFYMTGSWPMEGWIPPLICTSEETSKIAWIVSRHVSLSMS